MAVGHRPIPRPNGKANPNSPSLPTLQGGDPDIVAVLLYLDAAPGNLTPEPGALLPTDGLWRFRSAVDLLPDRLLVVFLPVGAGQRDGPAGPGPGRAGWGGPHFGADEHAGRELHGRA
jgi:hypothetical protein